MYMAWILFDGKKFSSDEAIALCKAATGSINPRKQFFQKEDNALKRHAAYLHGQQDEFIEANKYMNEIKDFNKPSTPKDNGMDLGDVDFDPAYSDWLRREVNDNVMKAYFCMQ